MPHHFFASYASSDNSDLVQRFFKDLAVTIRDGLNLPADAPVGVFEEYSPDSDWTDAAAEALQTSLTMVCLLSPAYLRSPRAGKEWQIFENRRRLGVAQPELRGTVPEHLAEIILPVIWDSCSDPFPKVVSERLCHPDRIYQSRPLIEMPLFTREYSIFVKTLASKIVEMTLDVKLPPLNERPEMNKVNNAFQLWSGTVTSSGGAPTQPHEHQARPSEVRFVEDVRQNEEASSSDAGVASSSETQTAPVQLRTQMKKYSVLAVSNNKEALDEINQCCRLSPFFELDFCDDPDEAIEDISEGRRLPELIVVDLNMEPSVAKLITELNEMELQVIGLPLAPERKVEDSVIEITPTLPKNDPKKLIKELMLWAEDGRKPHVRQSTEKREVFISFTKTGSVAAHALRKHLRRENINVSYSPDITPGTKWPEELRTWIAEAQIFVAFVSNGYSASEWCRAELTGFWQRTGQARIIPVYYDTPDIGEKRFVEEFVGDIQHLQMSASDFRTGKLKKLIDAILRALRDIDSHS